MEEQLKKMPRGLVPTPEEALKAARVYVPRISGEIPSCFLQWPIRMSYWGNNEYGDCVSAEEAFAKAAAPGYYFIPDCTVLDGLKDTDTLMGLPACQSCRICKRKAWILV